MDTKKLIALLLSATTVLAAVAACTGEDEGEGGIESSVADSSIVDNSDDTIDDILDIKEITNLGDYVTLGQYKGVAIEKAVVTDEYLTNLRHNALKDHATLKDLGENHKAALGNTVIMDYVGYFKDTGEEFEGGAATDEELELGSGRFIPGFEDALVGHKAGEKFDIFVTFPEDYGVDELNGREVKFAINLKSVNTLVYPELTEDFVKNTLKYESVEAFNKALQTGAEMSIRAKNLESAWSAAVANCTVKQYPTALVDKMVNDYIESAMSQHVSYAAMLGMEFDEYFPQVIGRTEAEQREIFKKDGEERAKRQLKDRLVMYAIADAEFGREISDEEFDAKAQEYADNQGITTDKLKENHTDEILRLNMLFDKVMTFVLDNAVEK